MDELPRIGLPVMVETGRQLLALCSQKGHRFTQADARCRDCLEGCRVLLVEQLEAIGLDVVVQRFKGDGIGADQLFHPFQACAGVVELALQAQQLPALWLIVEPNQNLPAAHALSGLNRQFDNPPADLGGHADFLHRFQLADGLHITD